MTVINSNTSALRATTACCTTRYISHSGATVSTGIPASSSRVRRIRLVEARRSGVSPRQIACPLTPR